MLNIVLLETNQSASDRGPDDEVVNPGHRFGSVAR